MATMNDVSIGMFFVQSFSDNTKYGITIQLTVSLSFQLSLLGQLKLCPVLLHNVGHSLYTGGYLIFLQFGIISF